LVLKIILLDQRAIFFYSCYEFGTMT